MTKIMNKIFHQDLEAFLYRKESYNFLMADICFQVLV